MISHTRLRVLSNKGLLTHNIDCSICTDRYTLLVKYNATSNFFALYERLTLGSYESEIHQIFAFLVALQVKEAEELEQAQRVTQEKKYAVHDELVRKAKAQEVRLASTGVRAC